jgi:hypothetical protein
MTAQALQALNDWLAASPGPPGVSIAQQFATIFAERRYLDARLALAGLLSEGIA